MSSGHGSSRRRSYGKRQRDLRDRQALDLVVDLEGPPSWPRGGAWDLPARHRSSQPDHGSRPGGPA
ncbi:MAG: hypothetical protein U0869_09245 [Chloroflexota bacterium]